MSVDVEGGVPSTKQPPLVRQPTNTPSANVTSINH